MHAHACMMHCRQTITAQSGIAEFAGLENDRLENDGLENDGLEQEQTHVLPYVENL